MSPSRLVKAAGLKNLQQVVEMTGQSPQTLDNWCRNKKQLFDIVIAGCVAKTKTPAPKGGE